MWLIILLFTVASARPQQNRNIIDPNELHRVIIDPYDQLHRDGQITTPAAIISQYDTNSPDGSFNSSYETSNGIKVVNTGHFKRIKIPRYEDINGKVYEEHEEDILVQTGSYSYFDPEGNVITLTYLADENGFQPSGDHIPKVSQETSIIQSTPSYRERDIIDIRLPQRPNPIQG